MSEHSIFGEAGGTGRRDRRSPGPDSKRANPSHGLFGAHLFPDECRANDRDRGDLPPNRN
jgi:hypothetical protein